MLLELINKKMNSPIKKWAKDPNRHITKEGTDQHVKRAPHHMFLEKCKLKECSTTYLIVWSKSSSPTLGAGEDMEH